MLSRSSCFGEVTHSRLVGRWPEAVGIIRLGQTGDRMGLSSE